ncbi:unnamed protein product [Schistocephalus solidus]|uniref:Reverse transcriptase domain-containing protein n=1 Tax=Schistocephalus solidus TaxID=70667 RepID=A0A183TKN5_SCHSO|nr:unnamed protein product [Schistocephalus solidus]
MSVYTEEPPLDEKAYNRSVIPTNKVSPVSFPIDTVRKNLKPLQSTKSPGPDVISVKALNELSDQQAAQNSKIFEISMEAGERTSPKSFRPVSLTSICCKMTEKIIKTELMRHIEENNLLSSCQYGFRSDRSCPRNLLTSMENRTKSFEVGLSVDAVYIDFSKAIDIVLNRRLIFKLRQMGVTGNLLKWLAEFLTGRCQRVCFGDAKSYWETVHSGLPRLRRTTGRMLVSLIHEHMLAVIRDDGLSQVAAHTYETGHEFNFAAAKIIAHARCKTIRELFEAWASDENSFNRFIDLVPAHRALRSHLRTGATGVVLAPAPFKCLTEHLQASEGNTNALAGLTAEVVLQRLESLVFQHHIPKFWAWHMADTFVVIEWDQVLMFKERLNSVFPEEEEEEENDQLAFFDVLVFRKGRGGLNTKVFRKVANTKKY